MREYTSSYEEVVKQSINLYSTHTISADVVFRALPDSRIVQPLGLLLLDGQLMQEAEIYSVAYYNCF